MPEPSGQPDQISSFRLKASYWYVSHKLQLRQGLIVFLIVLSLILYSYSLYKALAIFLIDDRSWAQDLSSLTESPIDYSYFRQANKAQELELLSFESADGRQNRYDFIAKVFNPNADFVAEAVLFQLISGNEIIAEKTGFIYPEAEKYIAFFGQEILGEVNPILKIAKVNWRRVRGFESLSLARLQFEISDIKFKSARESGLGGDLAVSTLNFKIKNNSAFSYWQVGVYLVLLSGQRVAGANYLTLDQFSSGETRQAEMRWYETLPPISKVEILPEVNILDPAVYMRLE